MRSPTRRCFSPPPIPASSPEPLWQWTAERAPPAPTWSRSTVAGGLAARLERALHVAVGLALGDVAPLVPDFLPAGERELDLRAAVLEVELRRHDGQPALGHLPGERSQLLLVHEQLAVAVGIV